MLIRSPKRWQLPESAATPEDVFLNRRVLMKGALALGTAGVAYGAATRDANALFGLFDGDGGNDVPLTVEGDPTADLYPAFANPDFANGGRALTNEIDAATYNNFYEFGSHKGIWRAAQDLQTRPWAVVFDGMVEEERTVDIDTLIRAMQLEERVYRHRCVEAWAMTVPWTGFPMRDLVEYARPLSSARYVRMETFNDSSMASGQRQTWYSWPYTEGLTMEEATHDLAFMVTGVYGKPIAKQYGAPIRLAVPWKYGFKSAKSLVRFTFTDERPVTFWEEANANEYGFWANVNPEVPHPRWSQASERLLGGEERVPTQLYNGYAEEVAGLYSDVSGEPLFM
ncbi:MAG: protein-methionine-sulfoxide reductase catalytic subunit MsrP [Devosiaceae bacterium]|nr:protein-methionine-sulfoxide reductase catalytic subunit MsrP [Devosiaceae bacterium MH13]